MDCDDTPRLHRVVDLAQIFGNLGLLLPDQTFIFARAPGHLLLFVMLPVRRLAEGIRVLHVGPRVIHPPL